MQNNSNGYVTVCSQNLLQPTIGVGYDWIGHLKELCEQAISNEELAEAPKLFPQDTPVTKVGRQPAITAPERVAGKCHPH